jgi:predicted ATPase
MSRITVVNRALSADAPACARGEGWRYFRLCELNNLPVVGWLQVHPRGQGPGVRGCQRLGRRQRRGQKSNLISFFDLLRNLLAGSLQEYVGRHGNAQSLLHYGPKTTPEIFVDLEAATTDSIGKYDFRLGYAAEDSLVFTVERMQISNAAAPAVLCLSSPTLPASGYRESRQALALRDKNTPDAAITKTLSEVRVYQFHDTTEESRIRATCDLEDCRFLYTNGANLPAILRRLRQEFGVRYDRLLGVIRMVAPFLEDFVLESMGNGGGKRLLLRWRGRGREYEFGPHHLSDGTLRFIALATLLLQPVEWLPSFIVIDEPELGLHPVALAALAELVREAALDTQVLLATQSAALVDSFDPEEVVVADREDGASVFRQLDAVKLREWLADYSLGELWRRNFTGVVGLPVVGSGFTRQYVRHTS